MKRLGTAALLSGLVIGCQPAPQPASTTRPSSTFASPATRPAVLEQPDEIQPPTGHACRVYLRRDALAIAGAAPPGPALEIPPQRGTVVAGILEQVTDSWLVLRTDSGRIWVPRGMVLMVELPER